MLEERETKTLEALLISPASSSLVVISKALTGLFYCLTAAALVLAFNASLVVHWGVIVLATLCGSLFTISIGLLLGSVFERQQQLSVVIFILVQPLLLPVGLSLLFDLLPETVITILNWIPTVALARVFRLSLLDSTSISQYGPDLAFVAGSGVLILAIVAWVVRRSELS